MIEKEMRNIIIKHLVYLSLVFSLTFTSCSENQGYISEGDKFVNSLEAKIGFSNYSGEIISIDKLTDFDWESLFIFYPYTPTDSIDKALGVKLNNRMKGVISTDDGSYLIVFTNRGEIIAASLLSRALLNLSKLKNHKFSPDEAIFNIVKKENQVFLIEKQRW